MNVEGKLYRTIWEKDDDPSIVQIIDQTKLPHKFLTEDLETVDDFATAIKDMHVRGAPLIGATAAYAMFVAARNAPGGVLFDVNIKYAGDKLKAARPTAVNLAWAVDEMTNVLIRKGERFEKIDRGLQKAREIVENDVEQCSLIGEYGAKIIKDIADKKNGDTVNILTHCNAGWLATVDWGTATAPIYKAVQQGLKVHVWVDETRPRNQGAKLTAWEFVNEEVPHTVIVDNAGGHLMQHGMVDLVIVGSDRTTYTGDVANKIGTYLKALAAKDNNIPFYVALPSTTIDWKIQDGVKEIPIEERSPDEVRFIEGYLENKSIEILVPPEKSPAANYAFDVTPSRLVTGLITERGVAKADKESILNLFPEKK